MTEKRLKLVVQREAEPPRLSVRETELRDEREELAASIARATRINNLYLMRNPITRLVKIGVSVQVDDRLNTLSCANGVRLELLAVIPHAHNFECDLHLAFRKSRTIGEWFRVTPRLRTFVSFAQAGTDAFGIMEWLQKEMGTKQQRFSKVFNHRRTTRQLQDAA